MIYYYKDEMGRETVPSAVDPRGLSVDELAERIVFFQEKYYAGVPAGVSDAYFDSLVDTLRERDPGHGVLEKIGNAGSGGERPKVEHIMFMHSQDKAVTPAALRGWAERVGLERAVVQHKLDGVSIELQYVKGKYSVAVTRGDGVIGDDVTENILRIREGVPKEIVGADERGREGFDGAVRGELVMRGAVHRERFPELANSRNTTAGLLKRKDGAGCEYIELFCFDARHRGDRGERGGESYFKTHSALLGWLESQGFRAAPWKCASIDDALAWRDELAGAREQGGLEYEIDGIIVKDDRVDVADQLRVKPKRQIALKFAVEMRETVLREVIWSQSGQNYTPIGVTDKVRLAGTTVQRANLVNPRLIREMGLCIGARVAISKRGEIIPKIEYLVASGDDTTPIDIPTVCGSCGGGLVNEDTRVICPNPRCPQRILHRIRRWVEVLGVKDFGEVLISQLFDTGAVRGIAGLYTLEVGDIAGLERQGDTSARKALGNLRAIKELGLAKFIAANDIENIGELTVEKMIAAGFDSLEKLAGAGAGELAGVGGIGDILAEQFTRAVGEHYPAMQEILRVSGITLKAGVKGGLAGVSFCFSGPLGGGMTRGEAGDLVRERGGSVSGGVTKTLDYLVTNENTDASAGAVNSKIVKAREYGRKIITGQEFFTLLDENESNGGSEGGGDQSQGGEGSG